MSVVDSQVVAQCTSRKNGACALVLPTLTTKDWNQPDIRVNVSTGDIEYRLATAVVAVYDTWQHTLTPGRRR
jgi:hypothetical protein